MNSRGLPHVAPKPDLGRAADSAETKGLHRWIVALVSKRHGDQLVVVDRKALLLPVWYDVVVVAVVIKKHDRRT